LGSLGVVLGIISLEPEQWFRLAKPATPGTKDHTVSAGAALYRATGGAAGSATDDGDPVTGEASGAGGHAAPLTDADVDALIAARIAARKAKDFAESDRIRDQLAAAGVIVEDKPGGKSTWRRA